MDWTKSIKSIHTEPNLVITNQSHLLANHWIYTQVTQSRLTCAPLLSSHHHFRPASTFTSTSTSTSVKLPSIAPARSFCLNHRPSFYYDCAVLPPCIAAVAPHPSCPSRFPIPPFIRHRPSLIDSRRRERSIKPHPFNHPDHIQRLPPNNQIFRC